VANMSLGGGASQAMDDAIRNSVARGVVYAVAAGNSSADACNFSPARAGAGTDNGIITLSAVDQSDNEAYFSNFGACVDMAAPGVGVLSTYLKAGSGAGYPHFTRSCTASSARTYRLRPTPRSGWGAAHAISGNAGASPSCGRRCNSGRRAACRSRCSPAGAT